MKFADKLANAIKKNKSLLCVGLDPDPQKLTNNQSQFDFNKQIIDQTADLVCCYKPQIAFYAAAGTKGITNLIETIKYIHKKNSHLPVLLDAKRADVGHTSEMYAKEVFDVFEADAVTVNPYCGFDSLEPFFKREDRGVFVICRTSNSGASDFQDLKTNGNPLYVNVAKKIVSWNKKYLNVYLEIGATWPKEVGMLRKIAGKMVFLIAGIGAQGGDLEETLKNGLSASSLSSSRMGGSKVGLIISSSRGIIYAQNPRKAAQKLRDEINKYR